MTGSHTSKFKKTWSTQRGGKIRHTFGNPGIHKW